MTILWVETKNRPGSLVDADTPQISAFDHGVTVGDGVFETIKTVSGTPFAVQAHLDRLQNSAALLSLQLPPITVILNAIQEVCHQNEVHNALVGRLRITCTSGVASLGSERSDDWTLLVAWIQSKAWPATASLEIVSVVRNEHSPLTGAKTTSYAENVVAIAQAKRAGADEALLMNLSGNVCEGASSNVFIVKAGQIYTPSLASGCLPGVTRALVIAQNPEVIEKEISLQELLEADEVFITSSTRDIQPVARVGTAQYSAPGKVTQSAIEVFHLRAKESFSE